MPRPGPIAPFSPALVAGLAARPLPPAVLRPLADAAMALAHRRHPEVFRRLEGLGPCAVLIDPIDLPFDFVLRPGARPPRLGVARAGTVRGATAAVRGPLLTLIDLLEGRIDGDALFFSRALVIEGDTAAVLALRNAVDGTDIDLVGLAASAFGPFAGAARRVLGTAEALVRRMDRDFARLQEALLAPVTRRCDAQAGALDEIEAQLDDLRRRPRRAEPAPLAERAAGEGRP